MAAVVIIGGGRGLRIEAHHSNQLNKSKLCCIAVTFTLTFLLSSCTQAAKTERFSYKGGCSSHGCICIEVFKRKSWLRLQIHGFMLLVT